MGHTVRRIESVMIVCDTYEPLEHVAALRATALSKELAKRGIEVVVLTASEPTDRRLEGIQDSGELTEPLLRVFRTPRDVEHGASTGDQRMRSLARLRTACRYIRTGPFPVWLRGTMRIATTLDRPAVILAIHGNATSLEVARRLSSHWQCPWVADFKDIWDNGMRRPSLRRAIVRLSLSRRVRSAAAITASSEGTARGFERVFGRTVHSVYSGIDGFSGDSAQVAQQADDHFRIVFTGHVSPRDTKLSECIEGIVGAMHAVPEVEVQLHYYGWSPERIQKELSRHGCSEILRDHGYVSADEARRAQRGADVLMHLPFPGMSVKYLEYVASGRPMLVIPPEGDDSAELFRGDATIIEVNTSSEVTDGLAREMRHWLKVGRRPDVKRQVVQFSWSCQAERLVKVLEAAVGIEPKAARRVRRSGKVDAQAMAEGDR